MYIYLAISSCVFIDNVYNWHYIVLVDTMISEPKIGRNFPGGTEDYQESQYISL